MHSPSVARALRRSLPIAVLAMTASAAGVFVPATYAAEAPAWAAQAAGQDLVNLFLVYPAMLALARRARGGSLPAYLCWIGLLGYSTYSYVLYAGYTHFSAWFPVYVAILGLSGWTLVAALRAMDPRSAAAAFGSAARRRLAGAWLVFFGGFYGLVELAVVIGAISAGEPPKSAVVAGLPTDPVLMLDLAFVLPGMLVTGLWMRRGRAAALPAGAAILAFSVAMGIAVSTMLVVTGLRLPPMPWTPAVGFAALTAGHTIVLGRLLSAMDPDIGVREALRPPAADVPFADTARTVRPLANHHGGSQR